jgi:transposase
VVNGIVWKLATGAPWRDVPERYGPWKTLHERHRRWTADGTWDRVLTHLQVHPDGQPVEWIVTVDSTVVCAHQHAAGARKRGRPSAARARRRGSSRFPGRPSAGPAEG